MADLESLEQNEINDGEWRNPDNWSGAWLFRAYFSKRDSRVFVPRYINSPLMPATLNLGHRWGFAVLTLMYVTVVAMFGVIGFLAGRGR